MCTHDQTYTEENEANGGTGCLFCHATRSTSIRDGWPTPAQNKATVAEAMPEAARMAEAMCAAFMAHQAERGLGCAGNSADEYDSSTEGHW